MTKAELLIELENVSDDAEISIRSIDGDLIEFTTRTSEGGDAFYLNTDAIDADEDASDPPSEPNGE